MNIFNALIIHLYTFGVGWGIEVFYTCGSGFILCYFYFESIFFFCLWANKACIVLLVVIGCFWNKIFFLNVWPCVCNAHVFFVVNFILYDIFWKSYHSLSYDFTILTYMRDSFYLPTLWSQNTIKIIFLLGLWKHYCSSHTDFKLLNPLQNNY